MEEKAVKGISLSIVVLLALIAFFNNSLEAAIVVFIFFYVVSNGISGLVLGVLGAKGTGILLKQWGRVVKILRQFIDYYQENKKTLFKEGCMAAICIGLYLCNEIFMKSKVKHWFFQGYFNDILGGVLLAVITDFLFDPWIQEKISVKVKLVIILSAGMYWEFASPFYIKDAVGDIWDLAAYCIGGGIQVFIKNYNQVKETSREEDMYEV